MISWPKVAARSSLAKLPLGSAHQEPERILNASRGPGPDGGRLRVPALPGPAGAHVVRCSGRALRKHGACNCAVSRALRVAHFWSPEWSIMAHLRCPWGRLCPSPPRDAVLGHIPRAVITLQLSGHVTAAPNFHFGVLGGSSLCVRSHRGVGGPGHACPNALGFAQQA